MAVTLQELSIDTKLAAAAGNIVASTENSSVFIGSAVFTNSNSTTETVTVWRLGSATVADATNFLAKRDVLPGKTWICQQLIGQVISGTSKIQASSTTADEVNANLSGTVSD